MAKLSLLYLQNQCGLNWDAIQFLCTVKENTKQTGFWQRSVYIGETPLGKKTEKKHEVHVVFSRQQNFEKKI